MERLRILARARAVWCLVAVLAVVQWRIAQLTDSRQLLEIFERFGLSRDGLLAGRIYELLSHALLHADGMHLAMNALAMVWLGAGIEWIVGARNAFWVYLAGVLLGGLGHVALVPSDAQASLLVGASGGVMAWFLYLTRLMPDARLRWLGLSAGNLGLGVWIASGSLALMLPALGLPGAAALGAEIAPSGLFRIGHACHFGGATAGALAAWWTLRPRVDLRRLQRERARRESRHAVTGEDRRDPR